MATNHAARSRGLWHRPHALNLLSDLILIGVTVAVAHVTLVWLSSRPLLGVRDLVVLTPPAQVTPAQLEYAARSAIQGNFFTVDLERVKAAFERLPWVRKAEVRRRWPGAIELRLEEHQAIAYWMPADSDEVHLINRQGEVFTAASDSDLPLFTGPQGSASRLLAMYRALLPVFAPLERRPVEVLLSERASWQVKLDDGLLVRLGRDDEQMSLNDRLMRFVRLWPRTREQLGVAAVEVDLRYPGGFALKLAGVTGTGKSKL